MRPRSYEDAVAALQGALKFGINPGLEGIEQLCEALGRPQDAFRVVQVTGTNGKTSTSRFIQWLLHAEGVATGLYTSPELERYPERVETSGQVVSDEFFAEAVSVVLDAAEALRPSSEAGMNGFTEFELTTAAALWLFREQRVETAVLEVGLGGRWDATSVARPSVSVITGVGLDHVGILGDTLELIAAEKAQIIRDGSSVVLGPGTRGLESVFLMRARSERAAVSAAREVGSASPVAEDSTLRYRIASRPNSPAAGSAIEVLGGGPQGVIEYRGPAYQAENVATALLAAERALGRPLDPKAVAGALREVAVPGRFELVAEDPPVVIDAAHNPQSACVLAGAVGDAWPDPNSRPLVLLGVLADKDAGGIVEALAPVCSAFAVTRSASPRAITPSDLAELVRSVTGEVPAAHETVRDALVACLHRAPHGLLVTGSITVAGEARGAMRGLR